MFIFTGSFSLSIFFFVITRVLVWPKQSIVRLSIFDTSLNEGADLCSRAFGGNPSCPRGSRMRFSRSFLKKEKWLEVTSLNIVSFFILFVGTNVVSVQYPRALPDILFCSFYFFLRYIQLQPWLECLAFSQRTPLGL